jgi:hypothetical protein
VLASHGAIKILLREDVLREISDAQLLVKIARADSQHKKQGLSGHGLPLKFHRAMLKEIQRHTAQIDALREQFKKHEIPESWSSHYETEIARQEMNEVLAIASSKWPGDRTEITGSGWAFELASAIRVYRVVKRPLRARGVSDRCLLMLAPIIASSSDEPQITPHHLRNELARRRK